MRKNRGRETLTAKVVGRAGDGSSDASLLYVVCGHRDDDGIVDGFAHGCFFSELSRGEHRGNGESGKWGCCVLEETEGYHHPFDDFSFRDARAER